MGSLNLHGRFLRSRLLRRFAGAIGPFVASSCAPSADGPFGPFLSPSPAPATLAALAGFWRVSR